MVGIVDAGTGTDADADELGKSDASIVTRVTVLRDVFPTDHFV